jgi:lipopolysaccharide transport system permease protein
LYSINPMVGIIEGFRWCIIPNAEIYWPAILISIVYSIVSLTLGIKFFSNFENTFADFI